MSLLIAKDGSLVYLESRAVVRADVDVTSEKEQDKVTTSLKSITRQMTVYSGFLNNLERITSVYEYSKVDVKLTELLYGHKPKKEKPQKTHSRERTNSVRRSAGRKRSKPKYFWGKKKRSQMGWSV